MNANEKRILLLCGIGHFFAHFYMLVFPSLALWAHRDLKMTLAETLNLGFWMYLLFGIVSLPMGLLADRYGHKKLLVVMFWGLGLSSIATGFSRSVGVFGLLLAAIGFFASIYHPVGIGLISKCCRSRGRALGNNGVWGNLGIGLGPLVAGAGAHFFGWGSVYLVSGLFVFCVGVVLWRMDIDEQPVAQGAVSAEGTAGRPIRCFVLLLMAMGVLGLCYRGTVVSIPGYFEQKIHLVGQWMEQEPGWNVSPAQSFGTTLLVSGIYLFGIFGQITGGRLADWMDLRKAYFLFHLAALPFMILLGFLSEGLLFVVGLCYLFFSLGMQPIENSLVARMTPLHLRSVAYGLKFILVLGMGAFSVKMVRWVLNERSPELVYMIQSGFIFIALCLTALLYWFSRRESFRNI